MKLVPKKVGDQALGRSRGGLSTNIHASVDALGKPLRCLLSGGQVADGILIPTRNGINNPILCHHIFDRGMLRFHDPQRLYKVIFEQI